MTRYRKFLIAPALATAALAMPAQAHAFSLASWWYALIGSDQGVYRGGIYVYGCVKVNNTTSCSA